MNIFLERNRGEFSNNVESAINLALSTKTRLLPNDNIVDNFSLYKQYNKERDECTKYRLILNVNPVCSNVLYNARTEIVLNEGSDKCRLLIGNEKFKKDEVAPNAINTTSEIDYMTAIRNTEYSHKENGGLVYHCGYDIFNNHMLRKTGFIHVNKLGDSEDDGKNYNTIFDYCRDGRGEIVEEEIGISIKNIKDDNKKKKVKMHLYQYDTIMSMPMAFMDNCIEKDGWWGFTNPNTIEIPNNSGQSISINRMLANNKACEFIDLYPDRSLFTFVPKFNKHKKRLEKNWDYCITYPYKSDYKLVDMVCGGENQAIKANIKRGVNTAGQHIVICTSYFKHNLKSGDYVTIYYYMPHTKSVDDTDEELRYWATSEGEFLFTESSFNEKGVLEDDLKKQKKIEQIISKDFCRYSSKVRVENIGDANGDNKDRVFTIKYYDVDDIYNYLKYFGCFYKKNVSNSECLYYFRKFKKLKSINGDDIHSEINKVAFSRNIYGDEMAQVIFSEDLDLNGILDNNGRPLSDVYFTVVKRNAGHDEWYNGKYNADNVEVSHCFGKVTSGIDFSGMEEEPFDYNIHYLHNMDKSIKLSDGMALTFSAWGETVLSGMPQTIENNITIDLDEFYGDIVEYDVSKAKETVIGNVYHRFNTGQRETWNQFYQHVKQDVIVSDDYDYANGEGKVFGVESYFINNVKNSISTDENSGMVNGNMMYGNIYPEGYYYNPHMKISLRENDDIESYSSAKYINYTKPELHSVKTYLLFKLDGTIKTFNSEREAKESQESGEKLILQSHYYNLKFTVPVNYGFYKGDYIAIYHKNTSSLVWGEIIDVSGMDITLKLDAEEISQYDDWEQTDEKLSLFNPFSGNRVFYAYWSSDNIPIYSKLCEGGRKFVWRNIVAPSKMMMDDELFETPFTNNRFYIEKNINFYLKRQDPTGKYGLSIPMYKVYKPIVTNPMTKFIIKGNNPIDFSDIMFTLNNFADNCF